MKNYLRGTPEARLHRLSSWDTKTGCINFTGYLNEDGYGRFYLDGKRELSHRAAYQIFIGQIPDGQQVLHSCDNPSCVNHHHFFLGTQVDNINDMVAKGRQRGVKGTDHHFAKLDPVKAFEIRWYAAMGRLHREVAADYGVSRTLVSLVVKGKMWPPECHD